MKSPEMSFQSSPSDSELGSMYLSRLDRLVRLRREREDELNRLGVDLIERAITATMMDCAENGAGDAARELLALRAPGPGGET